MLPFALEDAAEIFLPQPILLGQKDGGSKGGIPPSLEVKTSSKSRTRRSLVSLCLLSSHKKVGRGGGAERPPGGSRSQVQQLASGAAGPAAKKPLALAGGRKPHLFKKKSRGKSCAGVVIFAIIESVCRAAAKKKLFLPGKGKGLKQRSRRQRKQRQGGNGEEATARRQRQGGNGKEAG